MTTTFVKSPNQVATVFGLGGNTAPRSKNLFLVRFVSNLARTNLGAYAWQNKLSFVVKSVDRPAIAPVVEEVNQYNKKRQITTGYKIQPMKIVFYDTADSLAMQMWNDYSKYYYGDFSHSDNDYSYDATMPNFLDISGTGYGFQPQTGLNGSQDQNSGFFFQKIEVYQIFGHSYIQFDLLNPKITQFDPDDLDYASISDFASVSMTVMYEALIHRNDNVPTPISANNILSEMLGAEFNGHTPPVLGAATPSNTKRNPLPTNSSMPLTLFNYGSALPSATNLTTNSGNTLGTGTLSQFGNYDYGSLTPSTSLGGGTAADVAYLSTGNQNLSSLLNLPSGYTNISTPENSALNTSPNSFPSIDGASYDAATGTLTGTGSDNEFATSYIQENLVGGVAASSILDNNSANDQTTTNGSSGLALNSQSYGIINAQRPTYSQIGFNSSAFNSSDALSAHAGANIPGKYNTNGIPTSPIPYTSLNQNQIDPNTGATVQPAQPSLLPGQVLTPGSSSIQTTTGTPISISTNNDAGNVTSDDTYT